MSGNQTNIVNGNELSLLGFKNYCKYKYPTCTYMYLYIFEVATRNARYLSTGFISFQFEKCLNCHANVITFLCFKNYPYSCIYFKFNSNFQYLFLLLFCFQLIKTFYSQVYLARDGVETIYNPNDKGLYYANGSDVIANGTTLSVVVDVPAGGSSYSTGDNVTSAPRSIFLARSKDGTYFFGICPFYL